MLIGLSYAAALLTPYGAWLAWRAWRAYRRTRHARACWYMARELETRIPGCDDWIRAEQRREDAALTFHIPGE